MNYRFCPMCGAGLGQRLLKTGEPERLVCDGCEFVFYLDPKVAAGALVTVEGRLILLRRAIEPRYGMWVFPGGYVDRGEHPEQAAVREAREEAGIEVAVRGLQGVYHEPPGSPVVLIVYQAELISGTPAAADESLELGLFSPNEIPWADLAFPTTRAALKDFSDQSKKHLKDSRG
jgi:ADP-ribose pyrophosphatase YjhB (NUDIX family)